MNEFLTDYNRTLLISIKSRIELFNDKKIELGSFIDCLDSLYREMNSWNLKWEEAFFQYWLDLESIYAGMQNRNSLELEEDEKKIINHAVEKLYELVLLPLNQYTKFFDATVSKKAKIIDNDWLMCPDCIDGWETNSIEPMVICPKCNKAFHNPHRIDKEKLKEWRR
jgi:hypothetical protein